MNWSFFTKNWLAKIICLLLALGFWFYIANDSFELQKVSGGVPLRVVNLQADLAVMEDLGTVQLSVRPPQGLRKNISPESFEAYVDLEGLGIGSYDLPVKVSADDPEMQIYEINPKNVSVTLDRKVSKTFSVTPKIEGQIGTGYLLGDSQISPFEVTVSGAEGLIGSVSAVVAEVRLAGELSEIRKTVELKAQTSEGQTIKNVTMDPKTAEIAIGVFQETDIKTVGVKIKTINQPQEGYFIRSLTADPVTVVLRGRRDVLQPIEYIETREIDLRDLTANAERNASLVFPEGVTVDGSKTIKVLIMIDGQELIKGVSGIFEFKNLGDNLKLDSFSPAKAAATVKGKTGRLSSLTERDARVIVDLAGKGEGTFIVELNKNNVVLPDEMTLESLDVKEIQVIIANK